MRAVSNLSRIFRLRLRIHLSWSIAVVLITAAVVTQFPVAYPLWQRIILGLAATFLFLVAVSIRETVLSSLAISRGIPVRRVILFVFGGVFQVAREDTHPAIELLLATTGLLTNLVIAGVFYGIHSLLVNTGSVMVDGLVLWLAYIYFMLALFHFIPVFPLDAGRLLRIFLWKVTGDYDRATRITSWGGEVIGLLIIVGGILLLVLSRQWFNGLALVFIGWVLQIAAIHSRRQALSRGALHGLTVRDVIARESPIISRELSLGQLVRDYILVMGQRYFAVADGVKLEGVVTIRNIKKVPKERWDSTLIGEIMTPASELKTVQAEQPASSLLEPMDELQIDFVPVLEQDKVIGIVIQDNLMHLVRTRTELRK